MGLICACDAAALPNLVDVTCPQDLDQVVRIAFQFNQNGTPTFDNATPITELASWTALLSASDATKITVSPALSNTVIPASEASRSAENSNESVNGLGFYHGEDNIRITSEIVSAPQAVIDALDDYSCLSDPTLGASDLTVYMFLKRSKGVSRVFAKGTGAPEEYVGFEIFNFRVSSLDNQGYNAKTKYMVTFDMQADEFRASEVLSLDFNPLTLANVETSAGT